MTAHSSDPTPAHRPVRPDPPQRQHFEVLPIGPQVGLAEVVRAAEHIDHTHPGWRPEVVWSQAAAVIAQAAPGAGLARLLQAQQNPPQQNAQQQKAPQHTQESQQDRPASQHEAQQQEPQEGHEPQEGREEAPQAAQQQEGARPDDDGQDQVRDEAMLVELIAATDRMVSHYQAMQAQFVQELMQHRGNSLRGVTSIADEISTRLAITPYAGGAILSRSIELSDAPTLHQGLARGELSGRKVDVICDATSGLDQQERIAITDYGCHLAPTHTPPQLKKALQAAVLAADPARAEQRHAKEVAHRGLHLEPAAHGMAWLNLYTRAEDALSIYTCIDALAARTNATDPRGIDARRADALTGVFDSIMATGDHPDGSTLPTHGGQRPHLRITLTEPVLAADAQTPALLHGYGPITAGTARSLASVGTLETTPEAPSKPQTQAHWTPAPQPPQGPALGQHPTDPLAPYLPPDRPPDEPDGTNPVALADWFTNRTRNISRPHPPPTRLLAEELAIQATDAYQPSLQLRAKIIQRDQTCRYPTCQVPAWRCQLDHIHPFTTDLPAWAQTTETTLHALCTHHHQQKTTGQLTPTRDARTGTTTWHTPTGHTYTRPPEPADYTALTHHLNHPTPPQLNKPPPTTPPHPDEPPF